MKAFRIAFHAVLACVLSAPLLCTAASAPSPSHPYRVQQHWNVGGAGGWGYLLVDEPAHLLYVPRTDRVMTVDTASGKVAGEITGVVDARDVALEDHGRFGYVSDITDGTAGFVRVFDRSTRRIVASIPTGINPQAVVFEPATRTVLAFAEAAHSATLIDSASNQAIATLSLAGRPTSAIADGRGSVYVTIAGADTLVRIDAKSRSVAGAWALSPCVGATGLSLDAVHQQLFSACENQQLIAINLANGQVHTVGSIDPGPGSVAYDARRQLIFATSSEGKLAIFHHDASGAYSPVQQLDTEPGARALAVDSEKNRAYLVTAKFGPRTAVTSEELQYRPTPVAGSFSVIVVGP